MPQPCCRHHIACPGAGNLDFDSPFANLSAEDPDRIKFIGLSWGWDNNVPGLGNYFLRRGCLAVCESEVSQADADACAARQQLICDNDEVIYIDHPSSGPPLLPPIGRPRPLFTNQQQTFISYCPDGIGFSYTVGPNKYIARSQILADRMAMSEAKKFSTTARMCLGTLDSEVCIGKFYEDTLTVSGGTAPFTFIVASGTLPPGLFIELLSEDPSTMILHGTATTGGIYTFAIRVDDSAGLFMQKTFTINVTGIDNASLQNAAIGTAYSEILTAATMTIPLTWSIASGTLPTGLSLNSASGEISGTPTTAQTKTFTVSVTDGASITCTKQLSITVASSCPSLLATVVLPNHTSTGNYFVVYGATGDPIHPNEYFVSQLAAVGIVDADTNTYVTTVALPAGFNHLAFGGAQVGGGALHFQAQDAFFDEYALKMDLITHAWTQSVIYLGGALQYPSYDSTHGQIGYLDAGQILVQEPRLWILNAATLVQVSLFSIGVIGELGNAMCYSQSRDVYYFVGDTGGAAPFFLRGIRRSDGAQVLNVVLPNNPTAVAYLSTTDKIYVRTVGVSPLHYFVVVDATTGTIDSTTTLNPAAAIAGTGIEYWAAKDAFWLLGAPAGALQQNAILLSRQNLTEICTINAAQYRAGIYGAKAAVRRSVWPTGYQDMDIYQ